MRRVGSGLRVGTLAPAVVSPAVPLIWVPTCGQTLSATIANGMAVERSGACEGYKVIGTGINTCETLSPGSCMGAGAAFDCRRCWGAAARSCCSSSAAAGLLCANMFMRLCWRVARCTAGQMPTKLCQVMMTRTTRLQLFKVWSCPTRVGSAAHNLRQLPCEQCCAIINWRTACEVDQLSLENS